MTILVVLTKRSLAPGLQTEFSFPLNYDERGLDELCPCRDCQIGAQTNGLRPIRFIKGESELSMLTSKAKSMGMAELLPYEPLSYHQSSLSLHHLMKYLWPHRF